jgi:hypothetical protein
MKRRLSRASDRELNALMLMVDVDMTARGIEHPEPPYIQRRRRSGMKRYTWVVVLHAAALFVGALLWQLGMYGELRMAAAGYIVGAAGALALALAYQAWYRWGQLRANRLLRGWANRTVD